MTAPVPAAGPAVSPREPAAVPGRQPARHARGLGAWLPTWDLITTKNLEIRKRRGLMIVVALLILGPTVLILGLRLIFHAVDPAHYGPAGSPGLFSQLTELVADFGFLVAATLGAAAGTTDLTDGVFRHLVITGRSRLALYLARIPAGLAILVPLVAAVFTFICVVTCFAGSPQPSSVGVNGVSMPRNLDQAGLRSWLERHPQQAQQAIFGGIQAGPGPQNGPGPVSLSPSHLTTFYNGYVNDEFSESNPAVNEMVKIGLWAELYVGIGFLVGVGLGSLTGQRTLTTILLIGLQIIVTPILAAHVIPYFLDGQRLVVGVAMDQLRPAGLAAGGLGGGGGPLGGGGGPGGPVHILFGGRGALAIPPMPTWAMISVIVGWIVGWSALGAWRMATRDA
jgi:hypothetical protein